MYSDLFSRVYDAFGWNYYPEEFAVLLQRWMEKIRFVCSRCSISAAEPVCSAAGCMRMGWMHREWISQRE